MFGRIMFWQRLRQTLPLRLRSLFQRRDVEHELDSEFQFHLEQRIEHEIAAGRTPEEARYAALRAMDGMAQRQEECRDARRMNLVDQFTQDLRYAVRGLRRDPVLAIAATITLAICIGANTTVFSIVNSILLRPLPYPAADRLYWISERSGPEQMEAGIGADYYSLRDENRVFKEMAAWDNITVNWTGVEQPEQLNVGQVTPSFFDVMGTQPMLGRYLAADEMGSKAPNVVVLSYAFWRGRLASDPNIVGKTITLDRLPATVIGVMPQGFDFPNGMDLWKPLDMDEGTQRARRPDRPMRLVNMLAKAKPGISEQQLTTDMSRLTYAIRAEYPKEFQMAGFLVRLNISAIELQRRMTGDVRPALLILSGAVGLVLLIACANMANLLLARATARQRELAVRVALGSDRGRVVRQVLTESLALALPGGLLGIAIAALAVAGLNQWKPLLLVRYPQIALDVPVLLFTLGLTLLTGLLFGMAPAFAAAGIRIQDALKASAHTQSGGTKATRARQFLVVAELSVALVLLIGAGLLTRSFLSLARVELGFQASNLLTLRVNLAGSRYVQGEMQRQFYQDVLGRIRQLPMVRWAAVATDLPLTDSHPYSGMRFQVTGRTPVPMAQRPQTGVSLVSREFFQTMGIPLHSGRTFGLQDTQDAAETIVINEAFARKIFGGENPIGQHIYFGQRDETKWTIAGVVGDVRGSALGADPPTSIYRCECQSTSRSLTRMRVIVRTTGDPHFAIAAIKGQIRAVDSTQPVYDVKTMQDRVHELLAPQRFYLALMGAFAGIAIILAAVGVYGVLSYLVTRRTREIGIRMAMGARSEHVLRLVTRESAALVAIAAMAGLAGAWMLTRYLKSMLYGVTVLDGPTFVITPVVLAAIALAASLAPARRAARIDPMVALREE